MKYYPLLLIIYLTCQAEFLLLARGDSDQFVSSRDTVRIQNRERLQYSHEQPQDSTGINSIKQPGKNGEVQDSARFPTRQETQNEEDPQDKTRIKMTGNQLIVENLPEDGILEIYNIMGAKVYNRRVKAGTNQYSLSLPKGYYIIKIGKLTRKIAVK